MIQFYFCGHIFNRSLTDEFFFFFFENSLTDDRMTFTPNIQYYRYDGW